MTFKAESLESLCELIVDCPHSTPTWTDSGVIVTRNQNIKGGVLDLSSPSFTNEEDYRKRIKRAIPQAGDIIITREAPMGEVCMIPEGLKCCLGQRQVLLRPKTGVNGKYLLWALQSNFVQHQISWNEGTGSTVSNLRIPVLKSLQIPRLNQEDDIENILSSLASKIQANKQIYQTLEQIAQAIFKSWFVDFEPVKAKIAAREALIAEYQTQSNKAPSPQEIAEVEKQAAIAAIAGAGDIVPTTQLQTLADLFPNQLVESELGEIPEGWKVKKVEDIVTRLKPKQRFTKKQVEPHGKIPVYEQGSGILLGYQNGEAGFKATPESPIFIFGDHTCVTHLSCEPFDISSNVIPLEGFYFPTIWVYQAVKDLQEFQEYRRHWSEFIIKQVVTPSSELAEFYSGLATNLAKQKEANVAENSTLSQLRDVLLPQLLSGNLKL